MECRYFHSFGFPAFPGDARNNCPHPIYPSPDIGWRPCKICIKQYIMFCSYVYSNFNRSCFILCEQEEKATLIQTILLVSGISTLLQSWFGSRLPVVMGGSYAFIIPAISASVRFRTEEPHLVSFVFILNLIPYFVD